MTSFLKSLGRTMIPAAALILIVALAGCSTPKLYDIHSIDKEPRTVKRMERTPHLDYVHHITRKAYRGAGKNGPKAKSADQKNILEYWGPPAWVRKPFISLEGDKVVEWVYLDGQQIFQFIDGDLVYEGPMTDYEQTLIKRGYPDESTFDRIEDEDVTLSMVYREPFSVNFEVFVFINGHLAQVREGN